MVILRETVGAERVELQQHPIILATTAWEAMTPGRRQTVSNPALEYAVLTWDGDTLVTLTPSAAYQGAFNQYQTQVKLRFDIDIPNNRIIGAA